MPHLSAPKKLYIFRQQPTLGSFKMGERARATEVALQLVTIHPNPGPGGHGRTERAKIRRNLRRKEKREEKRLTRQGEAKVKEELVVVTWNVQRMSISTRGRRKMRAVAEMARKSEWDVILLSEVKAEEEGVVWLGQVVLGGWLVFFSVRGV